MKEARELGYGVLYLQLFCQKHVKNRLHTNHGDVIKSILNSTDEMDTISLSFFEPVPYGSCKSPWKLLFSVNSWLLSIPYFSCTLHNFYLNLLLVITKLVSACITNMKKNTFMKSNTTAQISLWKILPYISWTQLDRFVFKNWENQTHFQIGSDIPAPTKVTQNDEKYFGAEFCVWYGLLLNLMTHLL